MRVLAAQIDPVELAPEENLDRAIEILGRAAEAGADLVVLPETWATGYDLPAARQLVDRSEAVLELLADAARSARVAVVGSAVAHWELLLRARAVENQTWVVGVNRVGSDRSTTYAGRSQVIGPTGDVVAAAASDAEAELVVDLDLDEVRQLRARFPVLADRWLGVRKGLKA